MTVTDPAPPPSPAAARRATPPEPLPVGPGIDLPETSGYRLKTKVLGPALHTDQLEHERLGKPTALAVFASDALSSTAYATEEILRVLVPVIGFLAFTSFVLPITLALVTVLVILIFSYRQTIKAYPSAGGAYIVTKDNLGLLPAQVAGVALLTDYILTVAVSTSAGMAALYSAIPSVYPYRVPAALACIALIAWGNLRGVKESGRMFAVPTYAFVVSMFVMVGIGLFREVTGTLHHAPLPTQHYDVGVKAMYFFLLLKAFAAGGAAMTGVEAISNGVPAFKKPEAKNATSTLMVMGACLGSMFIGISFLAAKLHTVPSEKVTVISQIARATFGAGAAGHIAFYFVQAATMLILVLAANTSFADFPRLASFHADDAFMPKQLTKRGHRLVFSNGIVALAIAASVLVVVFQANVNHLIPLYAIGVFTSFTLSQTGMAVRHIKLREPGWRVGLFINGGGALATGVVTIVIGIVKFPEGAWFIMLLVPIMVALLVRLNRQYESESVELAHEVEAALSAPVLRRHAALVLVSDLDRPTAKALQYARSLMADEVRAVHAASDPDKAQLLAERWDQLGMIRVPLDVVDCPDRRVERSVLDVVADELADGNTEVSVLIPRREYTHWWHRLLHDRTADGLARTISRLPHANVTFVPYHFGSCEISAEERDGYHQAHHH
ncbi:APC family permease [Aquihabitans sp. G128]|uniref:APC family permease n=1 Tax=Aquihabitans sp. G128 TaxID=2849779 RepID=UPI001C2444F1|nr:APC family permease [Aquihabitans sp. G128]QXC61759.1 APC family permease [Aquihabitans sp. G128]